MGPVAAGHGQSVSGQADQQADPVVSRNKQSGCVFVGWMESNSDSQAAAPAHLTDAPAYLPTVCVSI